MGKISKIDKEGGTGIAKKAKFPIKKLNHTELRTSSYSHVPFMKPLSVYEDSLDTELVNISSPKQTPTTFHRPALLRGNSDVVSISQSMNIRPPFLTPVQDWEQRPIFIVPNEFAVPWFGNQITPSSSYTLSYKTNHHWRTMSESPAGGGGIVDFTSSPLFHGVARI